MAFEGVVFFAVASGSFDMVDIVVAVPEFAGPVEALSDSTEALGRRADRRVAEL